MPFVFEVIAVFGIIFLALFALFSIAFAIWFPLFKFAETMNPHWFWCYPGYILLAAFLIAAFN